MRRLFISYARENKRDIEQLVEHLGLMGYETWVDSKLRGGQDWWEEILRRIANSDVFIAVISRAALNSTACRRELDWAEALGRPVLPVAVEPLPAALPRHFARRQITDYSQGEQRDRAALILQGGLGAVPAAPPLPDPLPESPAPPLSYLTDLIDRITQPTAIDHDQQREMLDQLETALRAVDPEERRGGQDTLERFSSRRDLHPDVEREITRLRQAPDRPTPTDVEAPNQEPAQRLTADDTQSRRTFSLGRRMLRWIGVVGALAIVIAVLLVIQYRDKQERIPVVRIGADCQPFGGAGVTASGKRAYCSKLSSTGDNVWSLYPSQVPVPSNTPGPTDEVYPPGIEEQVRVCVDETGQTRLQCREDIQ